MAATRPVALVTGAPSGLGKAVTLALSGVRVLRVQPGPTNTPLPVYAHQRRVFEDVMAESMRGGGDPAVVAKVIVTAATDPKPKSRYPAGPTAGRVAVLRRIAPAGAFDKSIRRLNRMTG
jgi:NAD(P)-dependent dehydrogenase (short-subunit alcohol dehydrogenase family)